MRVYKKTLNSLYSAAKKVGYKYQPRCDDTRGHNPCPLQPFCTAENLIIGMVCLHDVYESILSFNNKRNGYYYKGSIT